MALTVNPAPMDPRIENIVKVLLNIDLNGVPATARETNVGRVLSAGLSSFTAIPRRAGVGIDGSPRNPDDARQVPAAGQLGSLQLGIEYKLYRDRKQAAGEMDRGLGQCLAYAELYEAVLFLVIYMGAPRDPIPKHWLDRAAPLRVGHKPPGVPVYFAARPRSWSDPWAGKFAR
ncbi:MAG: hypothetical protein KF773_24820 [Deltaproteobacteria bacterium]|nr:hypothetical protein [Deltaproteobacteria bacterium]